MRALFVLCPISPSAAPTHCLVSMRRGTAQALQTESGFSLEPPAVGQFRRAVLEGRWFDVEQLLESLPIDPSVNLKVRSLPSSPLLGLAFSAR